MVWRKKLNVHASRLAKHPRQRERGLSLKLLIILEITVIRKPAGKDNGKADIEGVPGLWIECKHQEKMELYPWMNQAVRDCTAKNTGDIPVVVHKQNRKETLVTLSLNDFFKLFSSYRKGGC